MQTYRQVGTFYMRTPNQISWRYFESFDKILGKPLERPPIEKDRCFTENFSNIFGAVIFWNTNWSILPRIQTTFLEYQWTSLDGWTGNPREFSKKKKLFCFLIILIKEENIKKLSFEKCIHFFFNKRLSYRSYCQRNTVYTEKRPFGIGIGTDITNAIISTSIRSLEPNLAM